MAVTGDPSCALHTQWSIEFGPLQVPRQVLDNQGGHLESLLNASKRTQKETLKSFSPNVCTIEVHVGVAKPPRPLTATVTDSHGHSPPNILSHWSVHLVLLSGLF